VSAIGEGAKSVEATATPLGAPGTPSDLSVEAGDGYVILDWVAPADGGTAIIRYVIYRGTDPSTMTQIGISTGTSYNDTAAANGQTYHYQVTAENSIGASDRSSAVLATPEAATGQGTTTPSSGGLDPMLLGIVAIAVILAALGAVLVMRRKKA
jgi:fibronectin type 3 domain-containing protein